MKTIETVLRYAGTVLIIIGIILGFIFAGLGDGGAPWSIAVKVGVWGIGTCAVGTFLCWLADLMTL